MLSVHQFILLSTLTVDYLSLSHSICIDPLPIFYESFAFLDQLPCVYLLSLFLFSNKHEGRYLNVFLVDKSLGYKIYMDMLPAKALGSRYISTTTSHSCCMLPEFCIYKS